MRLAADGLRVWEFVSDGGAVLSLLPGVTSVECAGADAWRLRMRQKVGFIVADFDVRVAIVQKDPPRLLRFRSEGKGVQIPALVVTNDELWLEPDGAETELTYVSEIQFSGSLAALGHAVMKVKARQLIAEFRSSVVQKVDTLPPAGSRCDRSS